MRSNGRTPPLQAEYLTISKHTTNTMLLHKNSKVNSIPTRSHPKFTAIHHPPYYPHVLAAQPTPLSRSSLLFLSSSSPLSSTPHATSDPPTKTTLIPTTTSPPVP